MIILSIFSDNLRANWTVWYLKKTSITMIHLQIFGKIQCDALYLNILITFLYPWSVKVIRCWTGKNMGVTSPWSVSPSILKCMFLFIVVYGVSETSGAAVDPKKDAQKQPTKSSSVKTTVMHENFKDAGKKSGLEIWRIEVNIWTNYYIAPYCTAMLVQFFSIFIFNFSNCHRCRTYCNSWKII